MTLAPPPPLGSEVRFTQDFLSVLSYSQSTCAPYSSSASLSLSPLNPLSLGSPARGPAPWAAPPWKSTGSPLSATPSSASAEPSPPVEWSPSNTSVSSKKTAKLSISPNPTAAPPTEFKLTSVTPTKAVFENPAHDFPKVITYDLTAPDSLTATISGGEKKQEFRFTRMK